MTGNPMGIVGNIWCRMGLRGFFHVHPLMCRSLTELLMQFLSKPRFKEALSKQIAFILAFVNLSFALQEVYCTFKQFFVVVFNVSLNHNSRKKMLKTKLLETKC